jgi:hypothetical protein
MPSVYYDDDDNNNNNNNNNNSIYLRANLTAQRPIRKESTSGEEKKHTCIQTKY